MADGLLLVCDESIELSRDVRLLCFDGKWQLYLDGSLMDKLWDNAINVCKGLGVLVDEEHNTYLLVWEDGTFEVINSNSEDEIIKKINEFIIRKVGIRGLSERAFIDDSVGIVKKSKYSGRYISAIREDMRLYVFKSKGGWEIYKYQVLGKVYYGVMNKEMTQWIVDIACGYNDISYTTSGVMIFSCEYSGYIDKQKMNDSKTHLIYNQEDIVQPFCGRLYRVNTKSDLYRYEYAGEKRKIKVKRVKRDEIQPLVIENREYKSDCLVRISKLGIEVVTELPEYKVEDRYVCALKYYSNNFMMWGDYRWKIGDYHLEYGVGMFCGYALNDKGQYHFNKNIIMVIQDAGNEKYQDYVVYCDDNGVMKGMIITPELGKVVGIDIDDMVYREEGGWLKIVSPKKNIKRYYYNGQVYQDMRLAYRRCEKVPTHGWVGQSLYACQDIGGSWIIGTQDMEPIGRKRSAWYESKEEVIEAIRNIVKLDKGDYLRKRISLIKESKWV